MRKSLQDWQYFYAPLDQLEFVMIGIADELPEHDEQYELHRLLGALLSKQLSIGEN